MIQATHRDLYGDFFWLRVGSFDPSTGKWIGSGNFAGKEWIRVYMPNCWKAPADPVEIADGEILYGGPVGGSMADASR